MSTDWKARAEAAEARVKEMEADRDYWKIEAEGERAKVARRDRQRLTVTDEMVERAAKIYAKRVLGSDEGWRRAKVDVRRAYTALARAALTAALENRHD